MRRHVRFELTLLILCSVILPVGCDSGDGADSADGGEGGSASLGCDVNVNNTHVCTAYWFPVEPPAGTLAEVQALCSAHDGSMVSNCSHTGALGGCQQTTTADGYDETEIVWYYSGTVGDAKTACTNTDNANAIWVEP
jgi:hypothetical protein